MTRAVLLRIGVGLGLFGATFVGGAALADWMADDEPERVLPDAFGDPIEVATPEPVGGVSPGDDSAVGAIGAAPHRAVGGGGGGAAPGVPQASGGTDREFGVERELIPPDVPPAAGAAGAGTDRVGTRAEDAGDAGDAGAEDPVPTGGEGLASFLSLFDLGSLRFLDPCTFSPEGCPEGEAGTVLAIDAPAPLRIDGAATSSARRYYRDKCRSEFGRLEDDEEPVVVFSNNPMRAGIEYRAVGSEVGFRSGEGRTSADVRREWQRNLDNELTTADFYEVWTCVLLRSVSPGTEYALHIEGVDDFGTTDELDYLVTVPTPSESRERPPVEVVPTGDDSLDVTVPYRPDQWPYIVALAQEPGDTNQCTQYELAPGGPDGASWSENADPAPERLADPGYPYDPEYSLAQQFHLFLDRGSAVYDLCIWWQTSGERSFDPARIAEREQWTVFPPSRYDMTISIVGLDLERELEPGALHLFARHGSGGTLCQWHDFDGAIPLVNGPLATPIEWCRNHATDDLNPLVIEVDAEPSYRSETRVPVILEPCTGSGERRGCASAVAREILVRIPGPRRGGGLCGSGFGEECEPPRGREDSPGSVRLRFDYRRGSAPLDHPEWSVTRGGAYDAAPTLEPVDGVPLDPFPRLDTFSLRIEPRPDFPERIAISGLVADRALTAARAFIDEASSPCTSGTAMLSADLMRGSGELFGLCRGTEYLVNIELTDEAGNVSVYSPVPRSGGWFELPAGRVATEPVRVTLEWTMRVTGIPERYEGAGETSPSIHLFQNRLILDDEYAYREGNYDYETRGHCINLPRYRVEAPAPAPAELGGALDVYLEFYVTEIDSCDRQIGTARGLRRSRVFIDQAIPTAELLSRRRATIRASNDDGLSVEVVIMVTPA